MLILSASQTQPDYVALAMVLVLAVIVAAMVVRKGMSAGKPAVQEPEELPVAQPAPQAPDAPGSAGHVKIHDVPPKTAAMLMAITADRMGKPLNELRFISIKEVK